MTIFWFMCSFDFEFPMVALGERHAKPEKPDVLDRNATTIAAKE